MFESLGKLSDLAKKEEEVLSFWRERKIFLQTLQLRKNSPRFIFYEGPPTTNGYPHAGHIIGRSIKDLIPRYKTMCGYYVPRKAGWDTHGLPVELEVEKGLGFSGKQDIENYGIDRFNEKCKESIGKYIKEWEKITERMGIWIDLDHPYITCSDDYIETLWWILKNLWERDLLYQGYKVLPYCSRCGTSLSSHEVAQGYRDVEDFSVYILFRVTDQPHTFFLVWTTTPWTLVANVALAVGEELPYVEIEEKSTGRRFVLNRERLPHLFAEDQYILIREMVGADLVGISYQPLMDFLHAENGYRVYAADFVSTEEGTGIVHIAPAFGEDDMRLAQWNALSILQPVKPDGTYVDDVIPWKGMWVKDADPLIIDFLKKSGKLFKKETCRHAYPFCWRCDTPLLYYAKRSWFIKTTAVKDLLLANNQRIHWHPEHIQNGRFGNFLENVVDWALSRERYWGTPLNIWICESCGFREAIGSKKELNERSREKLADIELHRPYVDQITLVCPECGGIMKRVPEVLDCWFDSGAMFVAQNHYPFENKETLDDTFPADFICEAIDQTRGWFYSLHVLASILFQSGAFRDCLVTELGLDEKGRKMSKHVGNVINPWELVSAYGADVLRWYVYSVSPPWVPKRFGKQSLGEVYSKFFTTLWNTVNFFVLYANIDRFNPFSQDKPAFSSRSLLDRWVVSRYDLLVREIRENLDVYEVSRAAKAVENFVIEDLSNWYIRRSRRRFWKSGWDADKNGAYFTLFEILEGLVKCIAPFLPFTSEMVYHCLMKGSPSQKESVHLEDYPVSQDHRVDLELVLSMDVARKLTNLGRAVRNKVNIKTRQPLRQAILVIPQENERRLVTQFADIIQEELNVKEIQWSDSLPPEVEVILKPRFAILGPRFGQEVKTIARLLSRLEKEKAVRFLSEGFLSLSLPSGPVELHLEEVDVLLKTEGTLSIESTEGYAVLLDTEIDDELRNEGLIREIVHTVQLFRKEAGFDVDDRIDLFFHETTDENAKMLLQKYQEFIKEETLSRDIHWGPSVSEEFTREFLLDEMKICLSLER